MGLFKDSMLIFGLLPFPLLLQANMATVIVIKIPGNNKHESFMLNGYMYKPT
jgi:hypothetical protein